MENTPSTQTPAKAQKEITEQVLQRINDFKATGELKLPENYSPENAVKSAFFILQETKTGKNDGGRPVLEACTKESIANSLLDMVTQGLNPMKKQCYFLAYGTKLTLDRSYQGDIAVAKRVAGVKAVNAQVVYEGDTFEYVIDSDSGRIKISKHEQKLENIDFNKIKGAYAVVTEESGETNATIMNILQIRLAWQQGQQRGMGDVHKNFTDEMCRKTVIARACKAYINSSDDGHLYTSEDEPKTDKATQTLTERKESGANKTELALTEDQTAVEVTETKEEPTQAGPLF